MIAQCPLNWSVVGSHDCVNKAWSRFPHCVEAALSLPPTKKDLPQLAVMRCSKGINSLLLVILLIIKSGHTLPVDKQVSDEKITLKVASSYVGDDGEDGGEVKSREKRYALEGSRWRVDEITYRISKYSKKMPKGTVDKIIRKAFDKWSEVTNLKFVEKKSGKVHIDIRFETGNHGDGVPFDGEGGYRAHAFFPGYGGDAHFDDDENWTLGQTSSNDGSRFSLVATHELGHALGLGHSDDKNALMAPGHKEWKGEVNLKKDDIEAIQALYGAPGEPRPTKGDASIGRIGPNARNLPPLGGGTNRHPGGHPVILGGGPGGHPGGGGHPFHPHPGGHPHIPSGPPLGGPPHGIPPQVPPIVMPDYNEYDYNLEYDYDYDGSINDPAVSIPRRVPAPEDLPSIQSKPRDEPRRQPTNNNNPRRRPIMSDQDELLSVATPGPIRSNTINELDDEETFEFLDDNSIRDVDNRELCTGGGIDTMVTLRDGNTYVFKGSKYWRLTDDSVDVGYPRRISQDWEGLPGNIDAAFTWKNGKTYFLKGSRYWRFSRFGKPDSGYPKRISRGFGGIPNDVDAAIVRKSNNKLYFFKGSNYWKFDPSNKKNPVDDSYPRPISNWKGIPNDLNAVLQYEDGESYFFKEGKYYKFDEESLSVASANPPYPRRTGDFWFGCQRPIGKLEQKEKDRKFILD